MAARRNQTMQRNCKKERNQFNQALFYHLTSLTEIRGSKRTLSFPPDIIFKLVIVRLSLNKIAGLIAGGDVSRHVEAVDSEEEG